jgi:hypothetical protein
MRHAGGFSAMSDDQTHDRNLGDAAKGAGPSLSDRIDQNIESMAALQRRERSRS